jgi:hypothetical protein
MTRVTAIFLVSALLVPAAATAQDRSGWGVVASFTPKQSWKIVEGLDEFIFSHEGSADLSSTDFSIGIARGRTRGGDWGVSFSRRSIADDSRFQSDTELCDATGCTAAISEYYLTRGVTFSALEVHKYVNFATIARRVQVGLNVAGGIGAFDGELERHQFDFDFRVVNNQFVPVQIESVEAVPARDIQGFSPFPLGRVEVAVGGILAPGLKLRVSGGFNFPGYTTIRVTGVYLFGVD